MSKKKTKKQAEDFQGRQGDVLVDTASIKRLPANATKVAREEGRVVLAHGEVTGHSHAIDSSRATLWEDADGARYLQVKRAVSLVHEEHGTIPIQPGIFRVIRQREYFPEAIRNVAD